MNPRETRRPLFVPVVTDPLISECWSENISSGGVRLVGRAPAVPPRAGDRIEVRLTLPDLRQVDAVGLVAWARVDGDAIALGVALTEVPGSSADALARFLRASPLRVVAVVPAESEAVRARIAEALGESIALEVVEHERDVPGYDVAVVLLWGVLPAPRPERGGDVDSVDAAPRIVVVGDWQPAELLQRWQTRRIHTALPSTTDAAGLRAAVLEACRGYGIQTELRQMALGYAQKLHALQRQRGPRDDVEAPSTEMIADSAPMRAVLAQLAIAAPRKVVVLLEGETGSGKEVLARAVHKRSPRARRPFVVQDCGTLTDTLLDSELFGHVRGAFTGANGDHPGLFVVADGGTVFLDEVENTTPALQAKLLRVIETGEVRPVGGTRTRVVDVRIVAATNTSLRQAVASGRFRADLFYRLSAFPIAVPPLRERVADIPVLVQRFLHVAAVQHGIAVPSVTQPAMDALVRSDWPGNVRQLRNVVERASLVSAARGDPPTIVVDDLPPELSRRPAPRGASLEDRVAAFERELIARALADADGVVARAATSLGVHRLKLARKVQQYGLRGAGATRAPS